MRAELVHGSLTPAGTRGIPREPKIQCWRFHDVREANFAIVRALIVRNLGSGAARAGRRNSAWGFGHSGSDIAVHAADRQCGPSAHRRCRSAADRQHNCAADRFYCAFESARLESDQPERKLDRTFNDESE
jgi:hypothetical protein